MKFSPVRYLFVKAGMFRIYVAIRCACSARYKADYEHRMENLQTALEVERVRLKAMEAEVDREQELLDTGPISSRLVQTALERPDLIDDLAEKAKLRELADGVEVCDATEEEIRALMMQFGPDTADKHALSETLIATENAVDRRSEERGPKARVWTPEERALHQAAAKHGELFDPFATLRGVD